MNYREAGIYTNRSTIELKTEFEIILEAMNAIGQQSDITIELLDFWLYGSIPRNYNAYINLFETETLLKKSGIPSEYIRNALSDTAPIDHYLLFKNACMSFIGEELTADFKSLVVDPLIKIYVEPCSKNNEERLKHLKKGRDTIVATAQSITKTITSLEKIKPHYIAGTDIETILNKLKDIEFLITHQLISD